MLANVQATLFNAHFRTDKKQPVFTPDMFMPGYVAPVQDWRDQQAMLKRHAQMASNVAQKSKQKLADTRRRHRLAAQARLRGATVQEIRGIMEGRLTDGS